ncbi:site-specific integrase [Streptomyces sp. RLB3-17]|uniref:tyrosine-type recombinase/integrase n=1 Tax=Streptomyces sp. RLB3-17 TaxID=2594455 RepID=UPI0011657D2E|nr:site-specific integrase [Streptomyces sp. RLB3-17]QDO42893.1 site-specific integrase [Streptomyces sp. RLB3-17]
MTERDWRVFYTRRDLPRPQTADPLIDTLWDLDEWLDEHKVLDGTPYLISPDGRYDIELNEFFTQLAAAPEGTQRAHASDLKLWLSFLWRSRGRKDWRHATPQDRAAYKQWRTADPRGPHVDWQTWDREVATVNSFYNWAIHPRRKYAAENPILQRESRARDSHGRRRGGTTPAEASHTGPRNQIVWLTPEMYRAWRDIGLRGYTHQGLRDRSFRGRFGTRNATYSDLMIRTGLRLCEQTSLSLFEVPHPVPGKANLRSWLPWTIAKYGSARWVYFPASSLKAVWDYIEEERAEAVEYAQEDGVYERIRNPLIITDRANLKVVVDGERLTVDQLGHAERRRLLIDTPDGLEPAALWLNERGLPSGRSCWQEVFKAANRRCTRHGQQLRSHPHALRHSFAVITLEQLWRGHIEDMAAMNPGQRMTHQMVFGDPLNWVRIRLGHQSVVTTMRYLHALEELEMETRLALIPTAWEPAGVDSSELNKPASEAKTA